MDLQFYLVSDQVLKCPDCEDEMKSHVDMRKNMDMLTIFLCSVLRTTEVLFQY